MSQIYKAKKIYNEREMQKKQLRSVTAKLGQGENSSTKL